ncbi:hypothetical protein IEQ34_020768 [Dendrobium chrysotoxum]|uniref:Uncharacterized protein n=1 Tax=Dendrobium chrysotoxum TaxID=161865 RepID=A0AAV7G134_DENCH|nr:hypothetical protein IEQ34_020768 [Dendrobium chrysotoxum]
MTYPSRPPLPQAMASSPSEDDDCIEVIKNVEKNKQVQATSIVSYSESLAFCRVVIAKWWRGLYSWDYFLIIKSEKVTEKIEGSLYVYVYTSSYGSNVKALNFKPNYA